MLTLQSHYRRREGTNTKEGELPCEISIVVSNPNNFQPLAQFYRIPYFPFPLSGSNKAAVEDSEPSLLTENRTDLIVLAPYMQVLSPQFVAEYPRRIINVHHSFLPAFTGARPCHAAFERGVKLIGATSHYGTNDLDEGPIIEQDVLRVSHRDQVADLIQKGRDLERAVLSRAVRWHLEHRILFYANKTVIFD
jgi:formyltetrahydrofolate deformylase